MFVGGFNIGRDIPLSRIQCPVKGEPQTPREAHLLLSRAEYSILVCMRVCALRANELGGMFPKDSRTSRLMHGEIMTPGYRELI